MPSFCSAGQSARVFFQYPGQSQDNVSVIKSPVTVTTEIISDSIPFSGGQCPGNYLIYYTYDQYFASNPTPTIRNGYLGTIGKINSIKLENGPSDRPDVNRIRCEYLDYRYTPPLVSYTDDTGGNYPLYKWKNLRDVYVRRIDGGLDNCGDKQFGGQCKFTVKDADGIIRFEKTASICPSYQTVCGGNCPPGTVECCGCCLPCSTTAESIRALTNQVRAI